MATLELQIFPDASLLTHSAESCFRSCPRKYALRYVQGLRPKFDPEPLRLGSAFHTGLEAAKNGGDAQAVEAAARSTYADLQCPPYLTADEFAVEEETAVAMSVAWHRKWAGDLITKYVAVELPFDLPLVNPNTGRQHPHYRNAGKIDGIAELPDGRLALVEHKSSGEDLDAGSDYWRRLQMDAQISRYWLAAHEMGYAVETVVYDVTRKPAIRPKKLSKTDRAAATHKGDYCGIPLGRECPERETPRMYGARLLDDMTAVRPEHYFARMEIPRLQSDLDEFSYDRWATVKAIQSCELDDYWPRNTAACLHPGRCTFLDICRGMRGDPDEGVPEGFRRAERLHPELATQEPAVEPGGEAL